jgi:hypothetical protein
MPYAGYLLEGIDRMHIFQFRILIIKERVNGSEW